MLGAFSLGGSRRAVMADGGADAELVPAPDREAWERLMVKLVALRGDPEVESFLAEKHAELMVCAVPLDLATNEPVVAADGTRPADAMRGWFERKLRGQCADARERKKLCRGVEKALRRFSAKYEGTGEHASTTACEALKEGGALEGPMICHRLAAGLVGTRFDGLRVAKIKPGVYQLGPSLVAVQADLEGGELLIHGHFDENGILHPTRCPVRTFLEEHGSRPPSDQCDMFGGDGGASRRLPAAQDDRAAARQQPDGKRHRELPPGWAKRESRSKPGVFYYVHDAKGLSQFDRPEL